MTDVINSQDRLQRAREFKQRLQAIDQKIQASPSFLEIMPELEPDLLQMLRAERFTIYKVGRNGKEIVSAYKSGEKQLPTSSVIKVALSTSSIAGFVALSQQRLTIADVYDAAELESIHAKLKFDSRYDKRTGYRTRSMVVVPIVRQKVVLGVFQIINAHDGRHFGMDDLMVAENLARVLAEKFSLEFEITQSPFDYLLRHNKISEKQLKDFELRALKNARQGVTVTKLLQLEAKLNLDEIGASLEHFYQVPFMSYNPDLALPKELTAHVSYAYLKKQNWVPIACQDNEVAILIDDPSDYARIMEIERVLGGPELTFRVGLDTDIVKYINALFEKPQASGELDTLLGQLQEGDVSEIIEDNPDDDEASAENENAIIKIVNQIITDSYNAGASDIHIEPAKEREPAGVRIRVDGSCRQLSTIPSNRLAQVIARVKIMSKMDMAQRRRPQDGKCKLKIRGQLVELRVATLPTVYGESAVMRILAAGGAMPLSKLCLSGPNLARLQEAVNHPHGLFLVVGPTGSGKTTTLHAVLDHLNTPETKIWTAEDPVEITQPGLQQVQVSASQGFTFADAMRSFLRADPDVILIGEMRDQETSHIGVEASLTGHLVLSTLHTNSAPETITRLLDLGLDPISFSDALLGILAQRLMRTLCSKCKKAYKPSEKEIEYLVKNYGEAEFAELGVDWDKHQLYQAHGCSNCADSGYRGRVGIHELMMATEAVRKMIYKGAGIAELREQAIADGMRTIFQDGIAKVVAGLSDIQQLHRVAVK